MNAEDKGLGILEAVLDRMPYLDGSGRRRLQAGGIVLVGFLAFNWQTITEKLGSQDSVLKEILASPIMVVVLLISVYALGSLVEMLGELFFLRAASGVLWAVGFPSRVIEHERNIYRKAIKYAVAVLAIIPIGYYYFIKGMFGYTSYSVPLERLLTDRAKAVYNLLPERIRAGLSKPVGNDADVAMKYVIDLFVDRQDQQWASRAIARAKDIAAITTALYLIMGIGGIVSGFPGVTTDSTAVHVSESEPKMLEEIQKALARMNDKGELQELKRAGLEHIGRARESEDLSEKAFWLSQLRTNLQDIKRRNETLGSDLVNPIGDMPIDDMLDKLDEILKELYVQRKIEEKNMQTAIVIRGIAVSLFIFVYTGVFMVFRNSIVGMLEVLALKAPPTVDKS